MFKIYVNDTIDIDLCTHIYPLKDKYLEVQPGERFSEKTLFMFNMIKAEVRVGAGGRGKLKKRWVWVEAMVLEKAQRSDTWQIWEICIRSSALA